MRPALGSISRFTSRSRVDLPAPERPMIPSICPAGTVRLTPSTAVVAPKRRVSACNSSIVARGVSVHPGLPQTPLPANPIRGLSFEVSYGQEVEPPHASSQT